MENTIEEEIERKIVCIIGSTKFREEIKEYALELTINKYLVLFAPFSKEEIPNLEMIRNELEIQHFQKIRMSDIVLVFNKNNYIGDSTKLELEYAKSINKIIAYRYNKDGSYIKWKLI